jgi:hypothetical protein
MSRLWKLLLSAQESPGGVPAEVSLPSTCPPPLSRSGVENTFPVDLPSVEVEVFIYLLIRHVMDWDVEQFIEAKKAELLAQREAEVKMQEKMMGRGGTSGVSFPSRDRSLCNKRAMTE